MWVTFTRQSWPSTSPIHGESCLFQLYYKTFGDFPPSELWGVHDHASIRLVPGWFLPPSHRSVHAVKSFHSLVYVRVFQPDHSRASTLAYDLLLFLGIYASQILLLRNYQHWIGLTLLACLLPLAYLLKQSAPLSVLVFELIGIYAFSSQLHTLNYFRCPTLFVPCQM